MAFTAESQSALSQQSSRYSEISATMPVPSPRRKRSSVAAGVAMPRQVAEGIHRVRSGDRNAAGEPGTGGFPPPFPAAPSRKDSAAGTGLPSSGGSLASSKHDRGNGALGPTPTSASTLSSWWVPRSSRQPLVVLQGVLKKRAGRINSWADRFFVLTETTLDQYAKGEDATCAEPKHSYDLDPCCTCSEIKDSKSGGRPVFYFQVDWTPEGDGEGMEGRSKEEGEGDADSGRSVHDDDERETEVGGGANPNPISLSTPPPLTYGTGANFLTPAQSPSAENSAREDGWTVPSGKPRFERCDSSGSLTGQQDRRGANTRDTSISTNASGHRNGNRNGNSQNSGFSNNFAMSPISAFDQKLRRKKRSSSFGGSETWNETIEGMVAAQRENEKRMATLQREELEQLSEMDMEKKRRHERKKKNRGKDKREDKKDKRTISNTNKAVAATAVGVSWLTAGVATGGLLIAGTLVAAGITVTVGSMGAYSRYKKKNQNGAPSRLRLASDKLEVVQQWRAAILEQVSMLRAQSSLAEEAEPWMGRGFGLWAARPPEGLPPALKAIDLRLVDDMLSNASWTSRGVMQGLPILEQQVLELGSEAGAATEAGVSPGTGWELGGSGRVLKTQTIVRASPLETFVALMGAPKHSMNAVMSGTFTVQSLDDHSDVVRLCLRPAWLKMAWASPRDFCLARYWHMSEDGCYIVTLSSMKHPLCPMDPAFVRGEAQLVYTISPRRESLSMPSGHASPECLLCCHVQVDPKGWIWNRLGMRELYSSQILMHVLEVRNVIEAERFVTPRVNLLRPVSSVNSSGTTPGMVGPRSPDGRPFMFEVLGAPEGGGGGGRGEQGIGATRGGRAPQRGSSSLWSSLEKDPPPALDPGMWTESNATEFSVRGSSYLTTRVKVPSAKQMFRLRAVDLFSVAEPVTHLAQFPTNRVQVARKAGENSFVWVLQLMVPGPPHYAFVAYFTPGADNWMDADTPFGRLASRVFFGDDDDFRDQRLKLIPKIVEGNWVVKRAAGTTPAILGTKLKQHHFRGDNYLETDLEIASSSIAANITRLCAGYAKSLVVDMVWAIQGNTEEELPEVALAGVRLNHLNLAASKPLDLSAEECLGSASRRSEREDTNNYNSINSTNTSSNGTVKRYHGGRRD